MLIDITTALRQTYIHIAIAKFGFDYILNIKQHRLLLNSNLISLAKLICVHFVSFRLTDTGLIYQFRKVILTRLGESVNHTCDLNLEKPYWYDVNGHKISERRRWRYQVWISAFETQLILLNLTLENGGVYFCNGANQYGSLIIYVQGNVCNC